jgi:hypothetical protein
MYMQDTLPPPQATRGETLAAWAGEGKENEKERGGARRAASIRDNNVYIFTFVCRLCVV